MSQDQATSGRDTAGTSQDAEEKVFLAMHRARASRRRIAAVMGISPEEVDVIRRRIERHEARDPLRRERSVAGTQIYKLDSLFFPPLASDLTGDLTGTSISGWRLESVQNDLMTKLNEARDRHANLVTQSRAAFTRVTEIEGQIAQLQADIERDGADSILDNRPIDAKLSKQFDSAHAELKTARHLAKSHSGAIAKQAAIVHKIEDELAARQYETFSKAVASQQRRLDAAVLELLSAAVDVADIAQLHGFQQSHLLVSRGDLNDEVLGRLVGVVRTALQAAYFWETAYSGNAPKFHKSNHQGPFFITQRAVPIDPIQQRITDATAELISLNERLQPVMRDMAEADRAADKIRYSYRNIENGFNPPSSSDQKEIGRLQQIVEQKTEEEKQIRDARKKLIEEVIPKLEKELQAKRTAVAA